jgi:hypothetical protein
MVLQAVCAVLGDLLECVFQLLVRKCIPVVKKLAKIPEDLLNRLDIPLIAVEQQLVAARTDTDIEQGFEIFDVLVLNAEKRVEALGWKFEFLDKTRLLKRLV